jgi:hypothetical protein
VVDANTECEQEITMKAGYIDIYSSSSKATLTSKQGCYAIG